jgi:hypothetical protein
MKKTLLSLVVLAAFTVSAQDAATNSEIAGNSYTDNGYLYQFNSGHGLDHSVLNCIDGGIWDTFDSGVGSFSVDSTEEGNGYLAYSFSGSELTENSRQSSNRFPVGNCQTESGDFTGNLNGSLRVKSTVDVNFFIIASSDAEVWQSHDADYTPISVKGGDEWKKVEFMLKDTSWNGNGDIKNVLGWELWFAKDQTTSDGQLWFDWIAFGDAEQPVVESTDEILSSSFNIYPNPATDVLNIKFDANSETSVNLMDLTGKIVASQNAQAGAVTTAFQIADLNAGIYFVNVKSANGSATQKVVIK